MIRKFSYIILAVFFWLIFACNLPNPLATPPSVIKVVVTSNTLNGSPSSGLLDQSTSTPIPPTATFTPWPLPYFGAPGPTQITPVPLPMQPLDASGSISFLVIGSDQRASSSFRTDTLIIANFQPQSHLISLISIPRDLYVYIPGWRMQRINAAYLHGELIDYPGGGPALLNDTILYNLGIKIDYQFVVNFNGFQQIIDAIGGIDVPVSCSITEWRLIEPTLDPEEEDNWELYTVEPGLTHMDGEFALWYARARLRSTDYDRSRRQQEVIRAVFAQGLALDLVFRLPELFSQLNDTFITDLTLQDILTLAQYVPDLSAAGVRSFFINNANTDVWRTPIQSAYLLLPNKDAIHTMLQEAYSPPDEIAQTNLNSTVEIWNGIINLNWELLAVDRLNLGGFETVISSPDHRQYSQTLLYNYTSEPTSPQVLALLDLFQLSNSQLIHDPNPTAASPFRLILGYDYEPCFDPSKITR